MYIQESFFGKVVIKQLFIDNTRNICVHFLVVTWCLMNLERRKYRELRPSVEKSHQNTGLIFRGKENYFFINVSPFNDTD